MREQEVPDLIGAADAPLVMSPIVKRCCASGGVSRHTICQPTETNMRGASTFFLEGESRCWLWVWAR